MENKQKETRNGSDRSSEDMAHTSRMSPDNRVDELLIQLSHYAGVLEERKLIHFDRWEDSYEAINTIIDTYYENNPDLEDIFVIAERILLERFEIKSGAKANLGLDTEGKGYVIAVCDDSEFYIPDAEHIERDDSLMLFNSDKEAAIAAEKDGVRLIQGMPGVPDGVYIDSEENRKHIEAMLKRYPEYKQWGESYPSTAVEQEPGQNESPDHGTSMRWS